MNQFVLHPEAYADLDVIWEYIARDNLDAADQVLEELHSAMQSLATFPKQGHARLELTSRPLRFHPGRDYVIVYAPEEKPLGCDCHTAWQAKSASDRCDRAR